MKPGAAYHDRWHNPHSTCARHYLPLPVTVLTHISKLCMCKFPATRYSRCCTYLYYAASAGELATPYVQHPIQHSGRVRCALPALLCVVPALLCVGPARIAHSRQATARALARQETPFEPCNIGTPHLDGRGEFGAGVDLNCGCKKARIRSCAQLSRASSFVRLPDLCTVAALVGGALWHFTPRGHQQ